MRPLQLLILGGTRFVGRAVVDRALEQGHQVTMFNRGITNPGLYGDSVEEIHGDRAHDLGALSGRRWDAVIDVPTYFPEDVARSVEALAGATDRYLFVSTISVYADLSAPADEDAAVEPLTDPSDRSLATYGARKAVCERIVIDAMGNRATVVRPGLIVGPHDPTDRFPYWPRRINQGGRVLAPGEEVDALQFIDVRDLGAFIVQLIEDERPGTFNATGHTLGFGPFLQACQQVCGAVDEIVWVPKEWLVERGLNPWMGVPLMNAVPDAQAANLIDISRALAAGLRLRPLAETVEGSRTSPPPDELSSFDRPTEDRLLAEYLAGPASLA